MNCEEQICQAVKSNFLPLIDPIFDVQKSCPNLELYREIIRNTLSTVLADRMTFNPDNLKAQREHFDAILPLVTSKPCLDLPGDISFYSLAKFRPSASKFFFDMVTCWLVPGRRLNVVLNYAVDFRLPEISDDVYTLCEVIIRVVKPQEVEKIFRNLPTIETEIRLGMPSLNYSRRILEIKGLSTDEKTVSIQEHIAQLIDHFPQTFDHDVLKEMQHVLVLSGEGFTIPRESRHLSRIIAIHYFFRKTLRETIKQSPYKRHLSLKIFNVKLNQKTGSKTVLAVLVGVNFLQDKEVFDKKHLLKAIQSYIPAAQAVENSFFINRRGSEHLCTLYLEIEKTTEEDFSPEEIRLLRRQLPVDLKDRIEHLMHPVFMPRNEEEIIRNVLSLSSQIKYVRDIPQVFISFDEQTHSNLYFTIILVRVLKEGASSIQEMFKNANTFLEYIPDRSQTLGALRGKTKKEAAVFRVKFPKEPFLRADHTIDLNKARQAVVNELSRVVGEVRDFNGGMISKQNELICELRALLENRVKYDDLLLENFFYSLTPVIMRTVLEPEALRTLFLILLEAIEEGFFNQGTHSLKILKQAEFAFVMIKTEDRSFKDELSRALSKLSMHSSQLANSYVSVYDTLYLGYIYRSDDAAQQQLFCQTVESILTAWEAKKCLGKI